MALKITEECINCDVCEPVCPNEAISMGLEIYEINLDKCTECIGHYDKPNCIEVCPVNSIEKDPLRVESSDSLWMKYQSLKAQSRSHLGGIQIAGWDK